MSTIQQAILEDRQRNRRKKTQSMILQNESESAPQPSLSASGTTPVSLTMKHQEHAEGNPYEPSNSGLDRAVYTQIFGCQLLHENAALEQHMCT